MSEAEEVTPDYSSRARRWRDWLARHLGLGSEEKTAIYVAVASSGTLSDPTFWAEILFSAGIATLGLTLGSPAVIIGAMLISPLMGPILSAGLALAAGDVVLAVRAALSIALSSAVAVAFSTLLVVLLPFREMTAEIASRTHPNTLDLVVALFSGAVGALAVSKSLRGVATSIPGVAIAVALMPPLCVTGYGIGVLLTLDRVQGLATLRGGALLFFTNLAAITFSSMLVFLLLHVDAPDVRRRVREWRTADPRLGRLQRTVDRLMPGQRTIIGGLPARLLLAFALLVLVWVPLRRSFDTLIVEIRQHQRLNATKKAATGLWTDLLGRTATGRPRSYIDAVDVETHGKRLALSVRAFVSERITGVERDVYLRSLARQIGLGPDSIDLDLVEIPTSRYQLTRRSKEGADGTGPPMTAKPPASIGQRLEVVGHDALVELAATRLPPAALPLSWSLTVSSTAPLATLVFVAPNDLGEDARALIAGDLRDRLALPQLTLRLQRIPARSEVRFARYQVTPSGDAALAVAGLAAQLAPRSELRVGLLVPADPLARQRSAAVAAALTAGGIEASRISVTTGAAACPRCVAVLIERTGESPP